MRAWNLVNRGCTCRSGLWKVPVAVTAAFAMFIAARPSGLAATPRLQQQVQSADTTVETVQYSSDDVAINAYLVNPNSAGKLPAVVLIHSNRGLDDPMEEIARRLAGEGFVVLAPDLASRIPGDRSKVSIPRALGQLSPNQTVKDATAGYDFLTKDSNVDSAKISVVGFGWGGWRAFMMAEHIPTLYRAVEFYGSAPSSGFENIHAPILAQYAQFDFRDTGNAFWMAKAFKDAGKKFTYYVYPDTQANFVNDQTNPHNAEATQLSWKRMIAFLKSSS